MELFSLPYYKVPTSWYEVRIKSKETMVTHIVLSRQFLRNRLNIFHIHYMVAVKSEDSGNIKRVKVLEPDCLDLKPGSATSYLSEFFGSKFHYL